MSPSIIYLGRGFALIPNVAGAYLSGGSNREIPALDRSRQTPRDGPTYGHQARILKPLSNYW